MLVYPTLIKGNSCFPMRIQNIFLMHIFRDILKEYKAHFVALNVDVYNLGSQIYFRVTVTLCTSSCTVELPITSIFLRLGWLMENMKSCYLRYEVSGDQCCG